MTMLASLSLAQICSILLVAAALIGMYYFKVIASIEETRSGIRKNLHTDATKVTAEFHKFFTHQLKERGLSDMVQDISAGDIEYDQKRRYLIVNEAGRPIGGIIFHAATQKMYPHGLVPGLYPTLNVLGIQHIVNTDSEKSAFIAVRGIERLVESVFERNEFTQTEIPI